MNLLFWKSKKENLGKTDDAHRDILSATVSAKNAAKKNRDVMEELIRLIPEGKKAHES